MSGRTPPTLAGFQDFLYGVMRIDPLYLPVTEPVIAYAFQVALAVVNPVLRSVAIPSPSGGPGRTNVYNLAVYNLAGSNVIQFAQDQPGRNFFEKTRERLGIDKFSPGVVSSQADQSTSSALLNPEFMKTLTLQNLQNLRDPWGRQAMAFMQSYGPTVWGIS